MIIHGDNLLALKSLLPQYEGRVDCIYIDPPYNTGNEKWVYNDNVNDPRIKKWLGEVVGAEGEDLSRHDKWLCMMYQRLKLLYKLLSDHGAIFISIDDNEQANLKLLCDEIFGRSNFVAQILIKRQGGRQDSKHYAVVHEYCVCYAKNILAFHAGMDVKESSQYPKYDKEKLSSATFCDPEDWSLTGIVFKEGALQSSQNAATFLTDEMYTSRIWTKTKASIENKE